MVAVVSDSERALNNLIFNVKKIQDNMFGDTVDVALIHHDNSDIHWKDNMTAIPTRVTLTGKGHLCKMQAWIQVTPEIASSYDYVWFLDDDVRLDDFSWDLYHRVLATFRPLVSQPAVLPAKDVNRSTDVVELRMVPDEVMDSNKFVIAKTVFRTEVQTPILSSKLWNLVWKRLGGNDLHNDYLLDAFWDYVVSHATQQCGSSGLTLVTGSPVTHYNWHDLYAGPNHCIHTGPQNNRAVSSEDFNNINAFLKDYCGYKGKIEAKYTLQQQSWTLGDLNDQMKQQSNNIALWYDQSHDTVNISVSHREKVSITVTVTVTALLFCVFICTSRSWVKKQPSA